MDEIKHEKRFLHVLSIDWDYFMQCDERIRSMYFPDGGNENIGIAMSNFVWTNCYATNESELLKVKVRRKELDCLKKYVDTSDYVYRYAVLDSHKHLGEFLLSDQMRDIITSVEIVNIDHHSDLYSNGEELDCGNWLNKVMEYYTDAKLTWVCDVDPELPENLEYTDRITTTQDISVCDQPFDIIYLCRSSIWSCPHLDKEFSALSRFLSKRACGTMLKQDLFARYDQDMKKDIIKQRDVISSFNKFVKGVQDANSK